LSGTNSLASYCIIYAVINTANMEKLS
jgi:hypothetical protein